MESISPRRVRTALCDQEGFYPFRSLLTGRLGSLKDLALAERFARAVVLHDAMSMEGEPMPAPEEESEWTEEQIAQGGRAVIVAFMPVLSGYGDLFINRLGPDSLRGKTLELSDSLRALAKEMSGAEPGDPFHDAHERYLYTLTQTLRLGSSVVCGGVVGTALRERASRYPEALFSHLDADLQTFAREVHAAQVGVVVPAVLSVVLSRCNTRDDVLPRLLELRNEWREPRERMWLMVDELRQASTVREMRLIQRELEDASQLLSPAQPALPIQPSRVLWDLVSNATAVAGGFVSGSTVATAVAIVRATLLGAKELQPSAKYIFRSGAIDFARRVRVEVLAAHKVPQLLDRFLTDAERRALQER